MHARIYHIYTQVLYARSEYHTQLAKMSFDKIFDLTAGVYFNFYNILTSVLAEKKSVIFKCALAPKKNASGAVRSLGKTLKTHVSSFQLQFRNTGLRTCVANKKAGLG